MSAVEPLDEQVLRSQQRSNTLMGAIATLLAALVIVLGAHFFLIFTGVQDLRAWSAGIQDNTDRIKDNTKAIADLRNMQEGYKSEYSWMSDEVVPGGVVTVSAVCPEGEKVEDFLDRFGRTVKDQSTRFPPKK
jgi:hypothetical protein